jgi:hypothetical protein
MVATSRRVIHLTPATTPLLALAVNVSSLPPQTLSARKRETVKPLCQF